MNSGEKNLARIVRQGMLLLIPVCALVGCAREDRVDLSGAVSWKGKPVPAGMVFFSPDVKAGNKLGPQGIAPIVDGRYDTRSKGGRRVLAGAQRVSIQGFEGGAGDEDHPHGKRLFMTAVVEVKVPEKSGSLDLVVPENVEALH